MFKGGTDPSHSLPATDSFVAPCHSPSVAEKPKHMEERGVRSKDKLRQQDKQHEAGTTRWSQLSTATPLSGFCPIPTMMGWTGRQNRQGMGLGKTRLLIIIHKGG